MPGRTCFGRRRTPRGTLEQSTLSTLLTATCLSIVHGQYRLDIRREFKIIQGKVAVYATHESYARK